jgi:sugar transferase (PEP-CTERM/EpsH1 system associated)
VRILFLCHRVPFPPNKGDKIRAFNQLRAMSAHNTVDLFTLADQVEDMNHRDALLEYCETVTISRIVPWTAKLRALRYLATTQPLTVPYFFSSELQKKVREALATHSYDRIYIYCSAMAQYVEVPEAKDIPVVIDLVDVDSDKWKQYAGYASFPHSVVYRREAKSLSAYERKICEQAAAVVVTTDREALLVREISPSANVHAIPNGVDCDFFDPDSMPEKQRDSTICFTGDMSYYPNEQAVVFFAEDVLPLIRREIPGAKFIIVGRQPTKNVLRLQVIEGVEVTGFVPDVRTHLARSQVSVAPFSIAAGIQNKVLEAMAYCLPVVATSRIALSMPATVAEVISFGDTASELASKIVELLRDPEKRRQIGVEGRKRVRVAYDWASSLDLLLALLDSPRSSSLKFMPESVVRTEA